MSAYRKVLEELMDSRRHPPLSHPPVDTNRGGALALIALCIEGGEKQNQHELKEHLTAIGSIIEQMAAKNKSHEENARERMKDDGRWMHLRNLWQQDYEKELETLRNDLERAVKFRDECVEFAAKQRSRVQEMGNTIRELEEENRALKEKHNSPPPSALDREWGFPTDEENDYEEEETIEQLREENQQLRFKMHSLDELISQCEPSIRYYLRGQNWRATLLRWQHACIEENDYEDAPKTIEQLREENKQLRLNRRSLENRISGCEPSVRDFLRG